MLLLFSFRVGRKPSETDSVKSKISSKTSRGKRTAQRHHHRHHQRPPGEQQFLTASLTFIKYFYLFLYLYITRITINNNTPQLKSPKNQNSRASLERPAMKLLQGRGPLQLICGRPTLALSSALVPQTLSCLVCIENS